MYHAYMNISQVLKVTSDLLSRSSNQVLPHQTVRLRGLKQNFEQKYVTCVM
jgi:lysyl-tRNA synthetase class II